MRSFVLPFPVEAFVGSGKICEPIESVREGAGSQNIEVLSEQISGAFLLEDHYTGPQGYEGRLRRVPRGDRDKRGASLLQAGEARQGRSGCRVRPFLFRRTGSGKVPRRRMARGRFSRPRGHRHVRDATETLAQVRHRRCLGCQHRGCVLD